MLWLTPALLTLSLPASGEASPFDIQNVERRQGADALSTFIAQEQAISLQGVLSNIGGLNSSLVNGARPGVVVASPSKVNPDYFYTWTRDSALTYTMLIDELIFGNLTLRTTIEDYTAAQAVLQTVTNPSGSLWPAGDGLGEAKFYTNLTRYDGTWGRPQRDGPALRAIAFMTLAPVLFHLNETDLYKQIYWPLVLNDLRYVGQYWNQTGYDLWEEVHGSSFFTIANQHRALVQGALLAEQLNTTCRPCAQAPQLLCFLQNNFWNASGGYLTANINANQVMRSGINADPILASISVFDANATCDAGDFQPCNSRVLATHKALVDSFRTLYPINNNASAPNAVLVGRYPEDTYYGGNPWPLCTFAAAEVLYDAVHQINRTGTLTVDNDSLAFFQDISPNITAGNYTGTALTGILANMTTYADGFVSAVQQFLPPNGSISEQFNRTTGESTSASRLTWSFASFVTMARRRAGQYPNSWGAWHSLANTNLTARQCRATSFNATGAYTPALAAGAPNITKDCASEVIFSVNASTQFSQNVYILGNVTKLGGALNNADNIILPLNTGNITSNNPQWYVDIWLRAGQTVGYQYVLQNGSDWVFERGPVRTVRVPACRSGRPVRTSDSFRFPSS
ncbi:hypothetical protein A1O7_06334 [Cladophialophora yegresii CBS 114405]|uniref:Glucoamylase n=1 Tax=Cladophialophora yegresii CBS 114405 TaxID=1182544 RepID=W9WKC3_9EURO|nr:uncharacterized protein A1O7_06334 [Cladophialophora yegresii CBS 114405]EXJ58904.1 hypothetical protein A1O7_06334 [Cladophialophora yegresii CBS 114405]